MWRCAKRIAKKLGLLKQQAVAGSASLVFMSLAFLTLLLSVNISLSAYQTDLSATTGIAKEASTLESIAYGALQEVFSTRFYPASNRLNWQFNTPSVSPPTSDSSRLKPFFKKSSFVMENNQVLARYQYVVIGGHPARKMGNNVNEYRDVTPSLIDPEVSNEQSAMYVLLKTVACANKGTQKLETDKIFTNNDGSPQCGTPNTIVGGVPDTTNYELKQYDLLTKVRLNSAAAPSNPNSFSVVYSRRVDFGSVIVQKLVELEDKVLFPRSSSSASEIDSTPDATFGKKINFFWFWPTSLSSASSSSMAHLERLLVETSTTPTALIPITGGSSSVSLPDIPTSTEVPTRLHLFFRGPMDSRSFYGYKYRDATQPPDSTEPADGSIKNTTNLVIQLNDSTGNSLLTGATLDFNYPNADHATLTLPQQLSCGRSYTLSFSALDSTTSYSLLPYIRDSYGNKISNIPAINFSTYSCPSKEDYYPSGSDSHPPDDDDGDDDGDDDDDDDGDDDDGDDDGDDDDD